ncbi:MAG TPA: hypothetical protein VF861_08065 [Telluria sp.]
MNQRTPAFTGDFDHSQPAPGYTRHDERQREIVDDGIEVQQNTNTMTAFEFLRARNVDKRIIERVLLEPDLRRVHEL